MPEPEEIICPICNNFSYKLFNKGDILYNQCPACKTVFCEPLDNSDMVGGQFEVERNEKENEERINRLVRDLGLTAETKLIDFGCGHGYFLKDLEKAGYFGDGYDAYNEEYCRLPEKNKYDIGVMVEVIEHLSKPYTEIDYLNKSMKMSARLYVETNFVDVAGEENISLEDFFYIAPEAGHATIFSHHSLDLLMCIKGFIPLPHYNRTTRLYWKVREL